MISGKQVAAMLLIRHTHVGLLNRSPDMIVYKEEVVIDLLTKLGLPDPDFDSVTQEEIDWANRSTGPGARIFRVRSPMQQFKEFIQKEIIFHSSRHTVSDENREKKLGMVHVCKQMVRAIDNTYLPMERKFLEDHNMFRA